MKNSLKIAVIPGDGIGNEVIPEGLRVLEAAGRKFGLSFELTHLDYSCERFAKTGTCSSHIRKLPSPPWIRSSGRPLPSIS